jgi:hypothetical protein
VWVFRLWIFVLPTNGKGGDAIIDANQFSAIFPQIIYGGIILIVICTIVGAAIKLLKGR